MAHFPQTLPSVVQFIALPSNTRHCTGSTIALTIRSFDPLECRRGEESCSIDISQDLLSRSLFSRLILWSETILRRSAYSKPVIERKTSATC